MPKYILKSIGSKEDPVSPYLLDPGGATGRVHFPRRGKPSIEVGDRMLAYAAGRRRVVGVAEITSDPFDDPESPRWPWAVTIRWIFLVPSVSQGATLEDCGIDSSKLRRRSHLFLAHAAYEHGVRAVVAAGVAAATA